jgi:hypothetical protein
MTIFLPSRLIKFIFCNIDATNNFDQARFFQENAEQVFQVIFETCMNQIEKIKREFD